MKFSSNALTASVLTALLSSNWVLVGAQEGKKGRAPSPSSDTGGKKGGMSVSMSIPDEICPEPTPAPVEPVCEAFPPGARVVDETSEFCNTGYDMGSYIVLDSDIDCPGGIGLTLGSGSTLDCRGRTISTT